MAGNESCEHGKYSVVYTCLIADFIEKMLNKSVQLGGFVHYKGLNLLNVIIQKRESEEGWLKVNKAMLKSRMKCADLSEEMKTQLKGALRPKEVLHK